MDQKEEASVMTTKKRNDVWMPPGKFIRLCIKVAFGFLVLNCLFGKVWCEQMPDLSKIPTPPTFIHEPNPREMFFVIEQSGSSHMIDNTSSTFGLREGRFRCKAIGFPFVGYKWTKNKRPFDLDSPLMQSRLTKIHGEGSFIINRLRDDDEGVYECFAQNDNGTAVDKPIKFTKTFINLMPASVETIDVNFGDPFEKQCLPPSSKPPARAYWILTSGENSERRLFQTINNTNIALNSDGKIFFQYVREEDNIAGFYYTCMAENSQLKDYKFGNQFNFNVIRNPAVRTSLEPYVLPQPQFYSPTEVTVLKGESLELYCIVAGFPDKIPDWYKNNKMLDYGRISWNSNFRKSMKIDNVTFQDEGVYACRFSHDSHLDKQFVVTVESAPYWVGKPQKNLNSSEGSTVDFYCNAYSKPSPKYRFYKNGYLLKPGDSKHIITGYHLSIPEIRRGDKGAGDNAVYQCEVINPYGSLWANFYLNILAFSPVILTTLPAMTTVVEGRSVNFGCKVFGSPLPEPVWKSDPQLMGAENVNFEKTPVDADGVTLLKLFKVQRNQAGLYACGFRNIYNYTESQGQLEVKNATTIPNWQPKATLEVGEPKEISCDACSDASLNVNYRWYFNNRPLEPSDQDELAGRKIVGNKLTLNKTSGKDSGNYTCVAETELDATSQSVMLIVKDVPAQPFRVNVVCKEKSADVSFYYDERPSVSHLNAQGDDPVARQVVANEWLVQYSLDASEPDAWETYHTSVISLRNGQGQLTVHLFPFGRFAFRVLAKNQIGSSIPAYANFVKPLNQSDGDRCVTPFEKPSRNPDHVHIQSNTDKSLIVSWEPLHRRDWNAPNLKYVLEYKPTDESAPAEREDISDPYRDSAIIKDVPSFKDYTVNVWAENQMGSAVVSPKAATGKSGESAPNESPGNFRTISIDGPSVATFAWDPVSASSVNGEFKGYKIRYWSEDTQGRKKRSIDDVQEAYFDPEAKGGSIYSLKPNTMNKAYILVHNNYGEGPQSPTIEFDMPEGVPSAVQDVAVFPIGNDEIGAIWEAPMEMNGNFSGYELKICQLKDGQIVGETCQTREIDPSAFTNTRVKGLNTSTPYRVEIRAKTNAGFGDPVTFNTETTQKFTPGNPVKPTIRKIEAGHDHLNITLKPGQISDPSQPLGNQFYLEYKEKDDDNWVKVNDSSFANNLTVTIGGLKPNTEYDVRAYSSFEGFNTASEPQAVRTHSGPSKYTLSGWFVAILVAIMILAFILLLICVVVRNRGAKYPVSEKEKEQGREPMLKDERGFGEYSKPDPDEDKKSFTAESVKTASETDSMAEYGDGDTGRFTEDGSFIGQYGGMTKDRSRKPNSTTVV